MRRNNLVWGVLLVFLGGLLMLDNLGLLPANVNVWSLFWPLALIGLGLSWVLSAFGRRSGSEVLSLPLEETRSALVKLRHGAGELHVNDAVVPGQLLDGSFSGGVTSDVRRNGPETMVDLRVPEQAFSWPVGPGEALNWQVGLDRTVPLALDIEGGASRMTLDLRVLQLKELRLTTGASATEIEFPAQAGETRAQIKSGAASVDMRVPEGVAARIRVRGAISSANIDSRRFARVGDYYESMDFASAENRLDLDVEYGVGSISVR
jgi:hypothetical protein